MHASSTRADSRTQRLALIGVTILGMAMCTTAVGKVAMSGGWLTFPGIAGSILGAAALGLVAARLLGISVPLIRSDRAAIVAIASIAVVKVGIAMLTLAS